MFHNMIQHQLLQVCRDREDAHFQEPACSSRTPFASTLSWSNSNHEQIMDRYHNNGGVLCLDKISRQRLERRRWKKLGSSNACSSFFLYKKKKKKNLVLAFPPSSYAVSRRLTLHHLIPWEKLDSIKKSCAWKNRGSPKISWRTQIAWLSGSHENCALCVHRTHWSSTFCVLSSEFFGTCVTFILLTRNIFKSDYVLMKLLKISSFKTDGVERRAML